MRPQILLLTSVLILSQAHAEIYKWTDDNGNVHYGDKPRENAELMNMPKEASPGFGNVDAKRADQRQKLLDAYEDDRRLEKKDQAKARKEAKRKKRACVIARDRLKRFKKASFLYDLDKDGNRVVQSDATRQNAIKQLEAQIAKDCH